MKKKVLPFLVAIGLILLVIAAFFAIKLINKYTPSKEMADLTEYFGIDGEEVALYLNEELQGAKGIYEEGQTYMPISWVNANLNQRFYWDKTEKLLVYALPESIVYADHTTKGNSGKPLIWVTESEVYLSLGLLANYTDIRMTAYDTADYRRIFINSRWDGLTKAESRKKSSIRLKGGIKSPILITVEKGTSVTVLENLDKWDKVLTSNGYVGYVEHKKLTHFTSEETVSTFAAPVYRNISMDEPVCLAWHQVTSPEGNVTFDNLAANTKGLNVISPTWFELVDNEGNFNSYADLSYVKKAHDMGMQVWALLNNFSEDVNSEILLSKTTVRQKLIAQLMKQVGTYGIDGINLDFEGIKEEAGVHYLQFIRELSVACRKDRIVLSIDNYVPTQSNQFYNRREQGIVADYVIIMGYDEHYSGGEAGSVASIGFVTDGIRDTLAQVPKEKVINAIPLYTRVWTETAEGKTSSSALGIVQAKAWIQENNVELYWQDLLGQYYGQLAAEDGMKQIWMEEERSIGLKLDLIKQFDLAGVACWKLGFEPADLWSVINPAPQ